MTRSGSRRTVDAAFCEGRLAQARAYLEAARQAVVLAERGQSANPVVSQIVLSAIAYADYLTARRAGIVNRQDHAAAPRLLRDVLRGNLPDAQESRYRRILATKDEAQYGARSASIEFARRLLADLEEFARWAESQP